MLDTNNSKALIAIITVTKLLQSLENKPVKVKVCGKAPPIEQFHTEGFLRNAKRY